MAEASPLSIHPGVQMGRVAPSGWTPVGTYSMCFGLVSELAFELNLNDEVHLAQTADVTGVKTVTFQANIRPPTVVVAGTKWLFTWGIGSAVHGQRELVAGRTRSLSTCAIDTSQVTGMQEIRFTLKLVSA